MDWHRIIPVSMALMYIGVGLYVFLSQPSKDTGFILFFVLVLIGASLSMIWSEGGGGHGWGGMGPHGKWRYDPPSFVRIGGWVLLLLPIWLPLIVLFIRWLG